MPRRSSSGGFGGRTSSPPPRNTATAQRPAPVQQAPPQQQTQSSGGMFSGLGGMVMQGMAFGAGSEVAHQAIRSITGSGSHSQPQQQQQQAPEQYQQRQQICGDEMGNFSTCLKSQSEIAMCQPYLDVLKECQRRNNLPQ
ncbi:clusterin protein (macronuclear) [Tetrahymena thermophila SB210]|uniref:Clusterin protein n=1 Tax=Tetrahymena thermophila (strain SB210) TaxID=312017 RepID=I7LXV9_TETTS|nr:clusterin protein [Tetrahymena thermophila SB210]EAS06292.2 clusterin protein [Tetrahymena thermophila SB210]|eukprot:XP_001026537.2 clusterin protein [Tetrahymena thermophila SB210]